MADPLRDRPMTIDEYLAWENAQERRHEYVDGHVYAMVGVTRRHSRIVTNLGILLGSAARGGTCRVHLVELKLRTDRVVYYPDVMIACGPEPDDEHVELDPVLVVEVLSPSTARIDRREKLAVYQGLPTLRTCLIVEQDRRLVEHHWREADGTWRHRSIVGDGAIEIEQPAITLTLDDIYRGVTLPSPEERRRVHEELERYG